MASKKKIEQTWEKQKKSEGKTMMFGEKIPLEIKSEKVLTARRANMGGRWTTKTQNQREGPIVLEISSRFIGRKIE